ncbi:MAG: 30S ribosomal protein S12 methylthiotransferase RimO [Clostridiales Family XIII bacterium]|jgi:ribosomal protein S12 methylthiotransferase|nr:30S ribosomal protein S12 methylthiotransferase RimO [Clostridiales Family XIII bacterium]
MRKRTIYIETLGCPKNMCDSEKAAGMAELAGCALADSPEGADAILVNTCGFIDDAKRESIAAILEMAERKKDGGLLIVSGCLPQRYGDELKKELPEVDFFMGVGEYGRLPGILAGAGGPEGGLFCAGVPGGAEGAGLPRRRLEPAYAASVKIAEGCDNRCAYCVIPDIRGPYRSRPPDEVLRECAALAEGGAKEISLIAQDLTAYGSDMGGGELLPDLVRSVCGIEGLEWLRLMYCYEDRVTEGLIAAIAEEPKVCSYIDLPLQHCSDRLLGAMRRRSTKAGMIGTIGRLRAAIPGIHIRTTLIVGLPGETEAEFRELLDFVSEMRFERLGAFAYSREDGTPAALMGGQVREAEKNRRLDALLQLQQGISLRHNRSKIGSLLDVLVERDEGGGSFSGRSRYDAHEIDNGVVFSGGEGIKPGDIVTVRVDDAFDYDLSGTLV